MQWTHGMEEWVGIVLSSPRSSRVILASMVKEHSHLFIWNHCLAFLWCSDIRLHPLAPWSFASEDTHTFMSVNMNVSLPVHWERNYNLEEMASLQLILSVFSEEQVSLDLTLSLQISSVVLWTRSTVLRQSCTLAGHSNHMCVFNSIESALSTLKFIKVVAWKTKDLSSATEWQIHLPWLLVNSIGDILSVEKETLS